MADHGPDYVLKDAPKTGTGNLLVSVQAVDPIMIPIPNDSISRMLSEKLNILRVNESASVDNEIDDIIFSLYHLSPEEITFIIGA